MRRAGDVALVIVVNGLEHGVSILGIRGLVGAVLWALVLKVSVAQTFAAVGFHVVPEVGVVQGGVMFRPPGCSCGSWKVSLGCDVHPVCFVICSQVLKFVFGGVFCNVLKIAE